jgi:uncharacterized protein
MPKLHLALTARCNLRCVYCPYTVASEGFRSHENADATAEGIEAALEFFLSRTRGEPNRVVNLFGGEPLLKPDLIELSVRRLQHERAQNSVKLTVTTNGTLLSRPIAGYESTLDFLVANDVGLRISLDGPPDYHDRTRVTSAGMGTSAMVTEGLRLFERYPEWRSKRVQLKVLETGSAHRIANIRYLESLSYALEGVNIVVVGLDEFGDYLRPPMDTIHGGERLLWQLRLQSPKLLGSLTCRYLDSVLQQSVGPFRVNPSVSSRSLPAGFCVPGTSSLLVDTQGNFTTCFRTEPLGQLGRIDQGLDAQVIGGLVAALEQALDDGTVECRTCEWSAVCKRCWTAAIGPKDSLDFLHFTAGCAAHRERLARGHEIALAYEALAPGLLSQLNMSEDYDGPACGL